MSLLREAEDVLALSGALEQRKTLREQRKVAYLLISSLAMVLTIVIYVLACVIAKYFNISNIVL